MTITTDHDETITMTIPGHEPMTMGLGAFHEAADRLTVRPPHEDNFGDDDFLPAEELARVGKRLIERHPDRLGHLEHFQLDWLWKKQGGKGNGRVTLGKCVKASGLSKHYAEVDFVIWLAADNVRAYDLNPRQIEALCFHELLHASLKASDDDEPIKPAIRGHDWEGFVAEIEEYGLWMADLAMVGDAVRQLRLPGTEAE